MKKKGSYLSERIFKEQGAMNHSKLQYWKELLGNELVDHICIQEPFSAYLSDSEYDVDIKILEQYKSVSFSMLSEEEKQFTEGMRGREGLLFQPFYSPLIENAFKKIKGNEVFQKFCETEVIFDFCTALALNLQNICMRTLILLMQQMKSEGRLQGEDPKEQYQFFCNVYLRNQVYRREIFEEYPVLYRCMYESVERKIDFFIELLHFFAEDMEQLCQKKIIEKQENIKVIGIETNFSDSHKGGKQVVKVRLNNKQVILYKPHSMENEEVHQELLQWLESKTGITQKYYKIYSTISHSWCQQVETESCCEECQLKDYYQRLGVQLFLAYVIGTKDLHCENLLACGAYPVLVDLETLVNVSSVNTVETAEAEIYRRLSQSVLYTGILPFYSWSKDGKGVNSSAIYGIEGQKYPFRIPVVLYPETSDMQIKYEYPVTKREKNLALLNGIFKEPYLYEKELLNGFQKAYLAVVHEKEAFQQEIEKLSKTRSRYLVADTQRYSMQLSSSYFPELLRDGAEREMLLQVMWLGRNWGDEEEKAIPQEAGIGWITEEGFPPFAGMAHGNSGIMLPVACLWQITREQKYLNWVKEILSYENYLYDSTIRNWTDARAKVGEMEETGYQGPIAWCHGAAGILLSRTLCKKWLKGTELEEELEKDIKRALKKVVEYPVRDSWSLCHGICGNLMILKECAGEDEQGVLELCRKMEDTIVADILQEEMNVLPQEKISFGIMNGWGGIAGMLCEITT